MALVVDASLRTVDGIPSCRCSRNSVDVVLVGGSSRIPRFRRLIKDFFRGQAPSEVLRPDHAGVLGAAVYAAALGHQAASRGDSSSDEVNLGNLVG